MQLIEDDARPVRPLLGPWTRTGLWLLASAVYVAIVVALMGLRGDWPAKLGDGRYLFEQAVSLLTALAAAVAAFASVVPGANRKIMVLPAALALLWVVGLGQGCLADWLRAGPAGLSIRSDWLCFPAIAMVGAGPALFIVWLLRRGAPLTPVLSIALAGLAAAGLGNFGLRLFHTEDSAMMVLLWQVGSVAVLTVLLACAGGHILRWRGLPSGR
ncbi:MAG: DUF1109 domain-containing protein [Proteobacteria bacterium]|nr:DUF1109 domain-containing protein [Pseudomonadota bacterium]